jgi:hypothetical protein
MSAIPNLSKGTLSAWLGYVKLTEGQEKRLGRNIEKI